MRNHESDRRRFRELWLAATLFVPLPALAAERGTPLEAALQYFTRMEPAVFREALERERPPTLSLAQKAAVLSELPPEGEVRDLDRAERRKLAGLHTVLRLHGREGIYEIKVVSVVQAGLGLHARAVVLISQRALALLDADEVPALVAHEIGHEYFWAEYLEASTRGDRRLLQELELRCDGLAVVTLQQLGIPASRLISGLEKLAWYNSEKLGAARNEDSYPSLADRRRLVRALVKWLGESPPR